MYTDWLGLPLNPRAGTTFTNFATQVCAFESCPEPDYYYRWITEASALEGHDHVVWLVERGQKPWEDEGFEST